MNTTISLEQTKAEFNHWRDNKETLGNTTPDKLRQQAVELAQQYSTSKVVTTLGLSGSVIKRWQSELKYSPTNNTTKQTFIALPNPQTNQPSVAQASIMLNDGTSIQLSGCASTQLLSAIAQACTASQQV